MSRPITKGATDQSTVIRIVDSTDGTPETGVTSATGGLDLKYRREGAVTANLTESDLSALSDAHSDGGMLHIGAGYYRVDLPDAAVASGADGVLVFGTVTNMVVIGAYHALVDAVGGALSSTERNAIADAIMVRASSNWEAAAPVKSLGVAVMKACHRTRDNAGTLEIYRSNGSTLHASQAITTDAGNDPIDELGGTS